MFGAYAGVHAVAILGSIYFEKGHFIKTAFVFFISMLLLVFLNEQVMELVFSQEVSAFPFKNISFMEGKNKWFITAPEIFKSWIETWIPLLIVLILWLAAYARLREKQV